MTALPGNLLPYGTHQSRGQRFQDWIENPAAADCIVNPCALTFDALSAWGNVWEDLEYPDSDSDNEDEHEEVADAVAEFGFDDNVAMQIVTREEPAISAGSKDRQSFQRAAFLSWECSEFRAPTFQKSPMFYTRGNTPSTL
jgi:hypothetical protein